MESAKKYTTKSAEGTKLLGKEIAIRVLASSPSQAAVILALEGNLGSGKTTFLQGFAIGLGIGEKVLSPTFILMKRFKIHKVRFKNLYHIDCYRLKDERDLELLGIKEIISNPENMVAIEWSEKISKLLPQDAIRVTCNYKEGDIREIAITNLR